MFIDATRTPATWCLDRIDQRNPPLNNSRTDNVTGTGTGVTAHIINYVPNSTPIWSNQLMQT